jgi:hypothetical protein
MSGKVKDFREMAKQIPTEVEVERPPMLVSRPPVTLPKSEETIPEEEPVSGPIPISSSAKEPTDTPVGNAEGVVEEPRPSKGTALVQQKPARLAVQRGARDASKQSTSRANALAIDKKALDPLSVRVPQIVRQKLDQTVLEIKMSGRKIKLEDVVTAALCEYLEIENPN